MEIFHLQEEKWNERISVCYRIRTGNAELPLSAGSAQPFLEGLLCNTFPVVGVKENLFMSALVYFPGRGTRCSLPQPVPAQPPALGAHRAGVSEQLLLGPGSDPV